MARTASPDYERPAQDVSNMKRPVKLPANKARQAENRGHMGTVLVVSTGLAIVVLIVAYYVTI